MGFVTLDKKELRKAASADKLQQALHANAKEQLLVREAITQLKAEGNMKAAENGRKLWLDLKAMHTSLEKLLKQARRR